MTLIKHTYIPEINEKSLLRYIYKIVLQKWITGLYFTYFQSSAWWPPNKTGLFIFVWRNEVGRPDIFSDQWNLIPCIITVTRVRFSQSQHDLQAKSYLIGQLYFPFVSKNAVTQPYSLENRTKVEILPVSSLQKV